MFFKKFVNLFLMKVFFIVTGLFGECLKMGLFLLMFFILVLIRDDKV